jgi:hypothetical protein
MSIACWCISNMIFGSWPSTIFLVTHLPSSSTLLLLHECYFIGQHLSIESKFWKWLQKTNDWICKLHTTKKNYLITYQTFIGASKFMISNVCFNYICFGFQIRIHFILFLLTITYTRIFRCTLKSFSNSNLTFNRSYQVFNHIRK